jgi:hypothetical protein
MGCCHTRDVIPTQRNSHDAVSHIPSPFDSIVATKEQTLNDEFNDVKQAQIEKGLDDLLHHSPWRLHMRSESVVVQSLSVSGSQGSVFSADFPVHYVHIELSNHIAPGFILSFLNDPEKRLSWDKTLKEMEVVTRLSGWDMVSRSVVDMKFALMKNREFFERKVIKHHDNISDVVIYSCSLKAISMQQVPISDKLVRGLTVFAIQRIEKKQDSTALHLMYQRDMKVPLAAKTANLVLSRLGKWARDLKDKLEAAVLET